MLDSKSFWLANMAVCVGLWIFVIFGAFYTFDSQTVTMTWWTITLALALGHTLELIMAIPIGRDAGLSLQKTIIYTLIFGFTWWVPVKRGIFKEE